MDWQGKFREHIHAFCSNRKSNDLMRHFLNFRSSIVDRFDADWKDLQPGAAVKSIGEMIGE
jgi:hypothetical protein